MGASGLAHAFGCTLRAPNESKVYLAGFHVDPHQLHPDLIRQPVTLACTLANKGVMGIIEMEVIAAQIRDMHEAFDKHIVQRHK
jgi:hypothetical protein